MAIGEKGIMGGQPLPRPTPTKKKKKKRNPKKPASIVLTEKL